MELLERKEAEPRLIVVEPFPTRVSLPELFV
jgi:hypothetical protein